MRNLFSAPNSKDTGSPAVDVAEARTLQQQGAQLIDVREPDEFRTVHAVGAANIPLGQLPQRLTEIDRTKTVLVICQSGARSKSAQTALLQQAFSDVRNVNGGTTAWQRAALPTEKG